MGSTETGANASSAAPGGVGRSCGLVSSLFPSSCRGRAEAFARRLRRRLTSLGGGADEDDEEDDDAGYPAPSETSWLHAGGETSAPFTATGRVFERQPRHSSDSDPYFDLDVGEDEEEDGEGEEEEEEEEEDDGDIETSGSPVEAATPSEIDGPLLDPETLRSNHLADAGFRVPSATNVAASPESDSSEIYYDPEASETEKLTDSFYDVETTDSESPSLANGFGTSGSTDDSSTTRHGGIPPTESFESLEVSESRYVPRFPGEPDTGATNDDSLAGTRTDRGTGTLSDGGAIEPSPSYEDSLNGRSSPEDTTSPSHESLWSTFDDSTVSLRDESPAKPRLVPPALPTFPNHVRKSHSDSELPASELRVEETTTTTTTTMTTNSLVVRASDDASRRNVTRTKEDEREEEEEEEEEKKEKDDESASASRLLDDAPFRGPRPRSPPADDPHCIDGDVEGDEDGDGDGDGDDDRSKYSSTMNIPGALTLECPSGVRVSREVDSEPRLTNEVRFEVGEHPNENGDYASFSGVLERPRVNGSNGDVVGDSANGTGNAACEEHVRTMIGNIETSAGDDDDENNDDDAEIYIGNEDSRRRVPRIRRSSSLKTGKTPPGTPGRKKIVRFADVLGLDLADVRMFLDEIPRVPNSAYRDLTYDESALKESILVLGCRNAASSSLGIPSDIVAARTKPEKILVPLFQQPVGLPGFLDRVREGQVCLENVLVHDPISLALAGTVRVRNLDYHKSVHVRYTLNGWRSFSDLQATYVPNTCDGFSDKFMFTLYCHTLSIGERIEFAVRYQCKGSQYWDNNGGANYCFQCLAAVPSSSAYIPITETGNDLSLSNWQSPTFY